MGKIINSLSAVVLLSFLVLPFTNAMAISSCADLLDTHWKGTLSPSPDSNPMTTTLNMTNFDIWNAADDYIRVSLNYMSGGTSYAVGGEGDCTVNGDGSINFALSVATDPNALSGSLNATYDPSKNQIIVTKSAYLSPSSCDHFSPQPCICNRTGTLSQSSSAKKNK